MTRHAISTVVYGDTEAVRDWFFGPQQHDEHCRGYRWELYMRDQRKCAAAMMEECRRMIKRARMANLVAEYMEVRT